MKDKTIATTTIIISVSTNTDNTHSVNFSENNAPFPLKHIEAMKYLADKLVSDRISVDYPKAL